ncbi:MAG: hypothetical protein KDB33_13795, partial [Acidimicrobiales bacterium]|nr:hypothetical protein [Acidimicrobiales bacterium]
TVGLTDVTEHPVEGGRIVVARVASPGTYVLWVGAPDEDPSTTTSTSSAPAGVVVTPLFTG